MKLFAVKGRRDYAQSMSLDLAMEDQMIYGSPSRTAVLTLEQYIRLSARERANIARVQIVPPKLGSDFGRIRVLYKIAPGRRHPVR